MSDRVGIKTLNGHPLVDTDSREEIKRLSEEIVDQGKAIEGKQPKGNYALKSEIPAPYTLPTASAEVKGGVKVGEGLQMDGDVLGVVPEGEYELIETITLEEDTSEIVRTSTPDGTAYKCKGMLVVTTCEPNTTLGSNLRLYVCPGINGRHVTSCGLVFFHTTYKYATKSIFRQVQRIWDIYGCYGSTASTSEMVGQTSVNSLYTVKDWPYITYLRLFVPSGYLPKGMQIKIYEVRANA